MTLMYSHGNPYVKYIPAKPKLYHKAILPKLTAVPEEYDAVSVTKFETVEEDVFLRGEVVITRIMAACDLIKQSPSHAMELRLRWGSVPQDYSAWMFNSFTPLEVVLPPEQVIHAEVSRVLSIKCHHDVVWWIDYCLDTIPFRVKGNGPGPINWHHGVCMWPITTPEYLKQHLFA